MNQINKILNLEDIITTYKNGIPNSQLFKLKKIWIPFINNSKNMAELAYLIGKITGDGHLSKSFVPIFIGQKEDILNLKKLIIQKFPLSSKIFSVESRLSKGLSYRLSVHNCLLGRVLSSLGAPKGKKTEMNFDIPNWIINNAECTKYYLQAIFEDELSTIKISKKYHSTKPRFKLAKHPNKLQNLKEYFEQLKIMLKRLDIDTSEIAYSPGIKLERKYPCLYFDICRNKKNIIKFGKEVGFKIHSKKIRHLKKCLVILKKTEFNRKPTINVSKIMALRKKGLTIRQISKKIPLNRSSVHRVLKKHDVREGI